MTHPTVFGRRVIYCQLPLDRVDVRCENHTLKIFACCYESLGFGLAAGSKFLSML
jgi:hypothetical protein